MKMKITTLMLCLVSSIMMKAQQMTDGFFYSNGYRATREIPIEMDELSFNSMKVSEQAPIGNGFFIMVVIAIIYVLVKVMIKNKEVAR